MDDTSALSNTTELGVHGRHVRTAHGIIMAVVFLCLKPAGAMMLRVIPGKLGFRLHVWWQMGAWFIALIGVGMGIWLASRMHRFGKQHPIIGFVVIAGMVLQPTIGYYHHILFVKNHKKTIWATIHVWLGRAVIILGIINGGIGLGDANNSTWGKIMYIVVASVSTVAYVGLSIFLPIRSRQQQRKVDAEKPPVGVDSSVNDEHI